MIKRDKIQDSAKKNNRTPINYNTNNLQILRTPQTLINYFLFFIILLAILLIFIFPSASAQNATVCCEKTISGLFCQDVPQEQCASNAGQVPTSCDATSYCKPGVCYDSTEGTCADNTPELVCNNEGGVWSETSPPQCSLGCCILGDQAAFVSLVRCKRLSSFLGLETNYNSAIKDEVQCVLSVRNQEKGACVFESEFERTCKLTTRADCDTQPTTNLSTAGREFFPGKLCSAEELGTICGPSTKTTCLPGKDGVYFIDTCGNPANIYDASKLNDKEYWTNIKDSSESCNPGSPNANSASCGNCNYLQGSICRPSTGLGGPTYGDNICADLNCKNTQNGKSYKHGESWCVYNDAGGTGEGNNAVGSRFFKHICINGEEVLEQCADFRQEICIEDKIETSAGEFSQAACRVNRWQDCTAQTIKQDCENSDRRDCFWKPNIRLQIVQSGQETTATTTTTPGTIPIKRENGACLPKNSPGLQFWQGEETKAVCAQANSACIVTFEKGLLGEEKCIKNCECLQDSWQNQRAEVCSAIGDCGPKINWVGEPGYKKGFETLISKFKSQSANK